MSANSPLNAIEAILPSGITIQQLAVLLAGGVCEAYAAYNNGSNNAPTLPGYGSINEIFVYEAAPNLDPFGTGLVAAKPTAAAAKAVPSVPAAYAGLGGAANACATATPGKPTQGPQLFGFTAAANDNSHNILVLRGTVTMEEAGYDLIGWGFKTLCFLPPDSVNQKPYGSVNLGLYTFYGFGGDSQPSLSASCKTAIQATAKANPNSNAPWFIAAHSLGGAMASLAALDAVVSGVLNASNTGVITYGSLHVGDQSWADAYNQSGPASLRIANLCDFVPSMVSLEPETPTDPYIHVGYPGTFTWQTWDDWGNHSLANIYQPIVQTYWDLVQWGDQQYPQ